MFITDNRRVDVIVELDNGSYILDDMSGVGKTYLFHLFETYFKYGEPVFGVTYYFYEHIMQERDIWLTNKKVVMFDRLDLYEEELFSNEAYLEFLKKLAETCVVLYDVKCSNLALLNAKYCHVSRPNKNKVLVTL